MKIDSYNNYGSNMNDNYYFNNKRNYYDPNSFFTLHRNQRSRSYNIDNRERHQPSFFNYSPKNNSEDYSIFNRNAISHSTLPTKYFSDYSNDIDGNRKFVRKIFNNSIRFAPTTTTIDGANRLHSKPLNISEPYLVDTFSKESPQRKVHQKNNLRSYPLFKKNENERYMSYDNISSNHKSRPINLYNNSPRNLFRYIYIEPRNEIHHNHLNKHVEMSKVDYMRRNDSPNFYNKGPILNSETEERYHYNENEIPKKKKKTTKQYMVYFCCFSFKWPLWRIEPLTEDDKKRDIKMSGIKYNEINRSREKYNINNMTNSNNGKLIGDNYM